MSNSSTEQMSESLPVVLAHGWGGSYSMTWRGSGLETTLAEAGRRLIAPDLPGHGRGLKPRDPAAYQSISETFLSQWSEPFVDAIGFSLGGKILLDLASRYPTRFRRIVIAGVGSNLFRAENGTLIADALFDKDDGAAPEGLRRIVLEAQRSGNDLHALSAVIRRPASPMSGDDLRTIEASVLLVAGTADGFIGDPQELCAKIKNVRLVWLNEVDHLGTPSSQIFQEQAARFVLQQCAVVNTAT